jgi:hypothetical protein
VFREVPALPDPPVAAVPKGKPAGTLGERGLLSSVCHDLKAPLASMTMGVAFLRRVLPRNDDPASRVVDALQRSAHRMTRTVASFSDLAKLQMGDLVLDVRPVPLGELMQSAFDGFLPEARSDHTRLTLEIDPATSAVRLSCDPPRLTQILWHLFAGVSHVVPAESEIALRAHQDKDSASGAVHFAVEGTCPREGPALTCELPMPELTIARGLIVLHGGVLETDCQAHSIRLSFSLPNPQASAPATRGEASDGN